MTNLEPKPRTINPLATTYLIYWEKEGVLKVGRCWRFRRILSLTATGGRVLIMARDTPAIWERAALAELDAHFWPAFKSAEESTAILPHGRGFTECYRVKPGQVHAAIQIFMQGIRRYANEPTKNVQAPVVAERGPERSADRDPLHGVGSANVLGRHGEGVHHPVEDQGGDLPAGPGDVGGADRGAPAAVGGLRLSGPVFGARAHVLRDCRLDAGGQTVTVGYPCPTSSRAALDSFANGSRAARGRGERERREGVGVRGRERGGRHLPTASRGCPPVTVLPSPSDRDRRTMPELRYRSPTSHALADHARPRNYPHIPRGRRHMNDFDVEVRAMIPARHFKHLQGVALKNGTSVGRLVVELVRRGLEEPAPPQVKLRQFSDHDIVALRELHEQGFTGRQIAERLGFSEYTISRHRKANGLKTRRGRPSNLARERTTERALNA